MFYFQLRSNQMKVFSELVTLELLASTVQSDKTSAGQQVAAGGGRRPGVMCDWLESPGMTGRWVASAEVSFCLDGRWCWMMWRWHDWRWRLVQLDGGSGWLTGGGANIMCLWVKVTLANNQQPHWTWTESWTCCLLLISYIIDMIGITDLYTPILINTVNDGFDWQVIHDLVQCSILYEFITIKQQLNQTWFLLMKGQLFLLFMYLFTLITCPICCSPPGAPWWPSLWQPLHHGADDWPLYNISPTTAGCFLVLPPKRPLLLLGPDYFLKRWEQLDSVSGAAATELRENESMHQKCFCRVLVAHLQSESNTRCVTAWQGNTTFSSKLQLSGSIVGFFLF